MSAAWMLLGVFALLTSAAGPHSGTEDGGAPAPRYTRTVKPDQVQLGEPFVYEVVLTHPAAERFELVPAKDLGVFELLEQGRSRLDSAGESQTTFRLKIALYDVGSHVLPAFDFEGVTAQRTRRVAVLGLPVSGLSALPKDADAKGAELRDIKGPADVPIRSYRLLWILAGLVALGALAYAVYRWRKRPPAPVVPRAELVLPLAVRTRKALDALQAEQLPEKGRGREFYFRVSEILRGYLGERYGFEALECTSAELLARIDRYKAGNLPASELRSFVLESDFIKFAKQDASPQMCESALSFGRQLVTATSPSAPSSA